MNELSRKLALQLYREGVPMSEITRQTGLPYHSVNYYRIRAGIPTRISEKKPNANPSQMLDAVRMNLQRQSFESIEKSTGIDEQQLRTWYTQFDIEIDARPELSTGTTEIDHSWPAMPADLETGE